MNGYLSGGIGLFVLLLSLLFGLFRLKLIIYYLNSTSPITRSTTSVLHCLSGTAGLSSNSWLTLTILISDQSCYSTITSIITFHAENPVNSTLWFYSMDLPYIVCGMFPQFLFPILWIVDSLRTRLYLPVYSLRSIRLSTRTPPVWFYLLIALLCRSYWIKWLSVIERRSFLSVYLFGT